MTIFTDDNSTDKKKRKRKQGKRRLPKINKLTFEDRNRQRRMRRCIERYSEDNSMGKKVVKEKLKNGELIYIERTRKKATWEL